MGARQFFLSFSLAVGLLMNDVSGAQSRAVTEVPHVGMSQEDLERAYIESYEQSGFRLASRLNKSLPVGSWTTELVFQLKSSPEGANASGTTLAILGQQPTGCTPCHVIRESFRSADADSTDPVAVKRGWEALVQADTAALAKVKQRLGVSLFSMEK